MPRKPADPSSEQRGAWIPSIERRKLHDRRFFSLLDFQPDMRKLGSDRRARDVGRIHGILTANGIGNPGFDTRAFEQFLREPYEGIYVWKAVEDSLLSPADMVANLERTLNLLRRLFEVLPHAPIAAQTWMVNEAFIRERVNWYELQDRVRGDIDTLLTYYNGALHIARQSMKPGRPKASAAVDALVLKCHEYLVGQGVRAQRANHITTLTLTGLGLRIGVVAGGGAADAGARKAAARARGRIRNATPTG